MRREVGDTLPAFIAARPRAEQALAAWRACGACVGVVRVGHVDWPEHIGACARFRRDVRHRRVQFVVFCIRLGIKAVRARVRRLCRSRTAFGRSALLGPYIADPGVLFGCRARAAHGRGDEQPPRPRASRTLQSFGWVAPGKRARFSLPARKWRTSMPEAHILPQIEGSRGLDGATMSFDLAAWKRRCD